MRGAAFAFLGEGGGAFLRALAPASGFLAKKAAVYAGFRPPPAQGVAVSLLTWGDVKLLAAPPGEPPPFPRKP